MAVPQQLQQEQQVVQPQYCLQFVPSLKRFSEVQHLHACYPYLMTMADVITAVCVQSDVQEYKANEEPPVTPFDNATGTGTPSVHDYLIRLTKYGYCDPSVFVCMLAYIDRMADRVRLTSRTVHGVVLSAFVVATKLHSDEYYANTFYARVGGTSLHRMNRLESACLTLLDWDVYVSAEHYQMYDAKLEEKHFEIAAAEAASACETVKVQPKSVTHSEEVKVGPTIEDQGCPEHSRQAGAWGCRPSSP